MARWKRRMACLLVIALIPLMGLAGPCDLVAPAGSEIPGPEGPEGPEGPAGQTGARGEQGLPGADGADGLHCWDLNGNGLADAAEDTNGDGTVDVLDCTADSLGCEGCDPRFVNAGETASITTAMIAEQAVTLNKLDTAGAGEGDVLTVSGGGATWGSAASSGPIVQISESYIELVLSFSWQTVIEVTVVAPTSGKVHAIGNASFVFQDVGGNPAFLGIAETSGGTPGHVPGRVDHVGGVSTTLSATTQCLFNVTPGSHTFYLVAKGMRDTSDVASLIHPQLSVTYYPD